MRTGVLSFVFNFWLKGIYHVVCVVDICYVYWVFTFTFNVHNQLAPASVGLIRFDWSESGVQMPSIGSQFMFLDDRMRVTELHVYQF